DRHLVGGRALGRLDPGVGHAIHARLRLYVGVVRIEEELELRLVEIPRVFGGCRALDLVGVIKQDAEVADAPNTGFRAHGRHPGLDARIAERAFFRLPRSPIVVDLLVGAARYAHAPTATLVLVDKDDAVLLALVDRAGRAGGDAARIEAVLADARQIHHERVFELPVDILLHCLEIVVLGALGELAAKDFLPVRPPFDLVHRAAADERDRARDRRGRQLMCGMQEFVIEGERLVVVVDVGEMRIGEDLGEDRQAPALLRHDLAVLAALPAAAPALLVFPVLGIADAGLGLDIVDPRVFHAQTRGPDVLAGDRAGMAADALVEIHHHRDLGADLHDAASSATAGTG